MLSHVSNVQVGRRSEGNPSKAPRNQPVEAILMRLFQLAGVQENADSAAGASSATSRAGTARGATIRSANRGIANRGKGAARGGKGARGRGARGKAAPGSGPRGGAA